MKKEEFDKKMNEAIAEVLKNTDSLFDEGMDPEEKGSLIGGSILEKFGQMISPEVDPYDDETAEMFEWLSEYMDTDCDFDPSEEEMSENIFSGLYVLETFPDGPNKQLNEFLKSIQ